MEPQAKKCVFFGYSNTKKGNRCYHPLTKKINISADVTFNELEMFYQTKRAQCEDQATRQDNNMDFLTYPRFETCLIEIHKKQEGLPKSSSVQQQQGLSESPSLLQQEGPPEHASQQGQPSGPLVKDAIRREDEAPRPTE